MKTKNKTLPFYKSAAFIVAIQGIVSLISVYFINRLQLLPSRYLTLVIICVSILFLIVSLVVIKSKNNLQNGFKILSLLISLSLIVGSYYLNYTKQFINDVTGQDKDLHEVSVVVHIDSNYESIEDIKDLLVLVNENLDQGNINKAIDSIKTQFDFTLNTKSVSYDVLGAELLSKTSDVALISESHRDLIEEQVTGFSDNTKVIGTLKFEEEVFIDKPQVNVGSDTFSIYITGIDTYGPVSKVSRSDVNMIMTVNPSTGQMLLTSIPRDYHVVLGTKGKLDKLTHAGIYGVNESVKTLENLLDIDIDYYLKVNFSSVTNIVNALGGVEVYSKYSFTTGGSYTFSKGINTVDGAKALAFVRERYSLPNGDRDRVVNQQELIKGILQKAMSPKMITNYTQILNSVKGSMQMSIPESDFSTLIRNQLDSNQSWEILQYSLNGTGATSTTTYSMPGPALYVMNPDMNTVNQASEYIKAMEQNEVITALN